MKTPRRFACPKHFDTQTELECLDCMGMPAINGSSAEDYTVDTTVCRAVPTAYLIRWAVTRWKETFPDTSDFELQTS